ncbi:pyrimidine-nucleoside phosphorylase [Clostridium pasteurianum DSM 525 = ATCC 6013]|uniref:Pyrimidine-nucleoside phosphorylase n=1 Tax=Clostridium pasteurianum DSM 525 = ATCC 6013 TaxID=1262449 RepID=A0A0H3J9V0_CLOPA|nr:pyrimidine-nucleoside phosphorylase [Clostridium pasteurianum]AJA48000.1 pyrimidine-nucleoside phosphorylase [Clostridium pasteurianum DSM 525 = ATCC 6013]AJA51988.1 pyrimidine-nucleoside phosphorylase [Clostridium pasteurianum DSM 525 = ATCC 6013]AOZ75285.1 thymidine phosphorylase [Clostridium pasteurianum DSM 525 = ATCC 6013]AOZ79080.1 thymidine phosphorylase [Clostridium pasteurianum]ELP59903.1 pyrimidine-nucleoside phosphorylase [Clostridium pasteurianum DSM 525 = ATCC 6013]
MRVVDLINKKKDGKILSKEEIQFIVSGYTNGHIPDYQMAAFLMAIYFKGMNRDEISNLTLSYIESGDIIDLSSIDGIKVDKHSSGGVGDKISLIVIPLVAALGIPVAKMSGRGLGHTGGTIDKLESIEGFNTNLDMNTFIDNVNKYKMAIAGQTANLTPADKKTYALRDVTGSVDSIPLIASSIMSKKIASGADAIVLDVKVGAGAFMKSLDKAKELAETMVDIGKSLNRKTIAIITNMNEPLGREVGNANEVREAMEVLKGNGSEDETTVALTIASYMSILGGVFEDFDSAYMKLKHIIKSGKAIEKFREFVRIQGGNTDIIGNPDMLPKAKNNIEIRAKKDGYIKFIKADNIGLAAMLLGAGRKNKEDTIDFSAGITVNKKYGEKVSKGDTVFVLHTNIENYTEAENIVKNSFSISKVKPAAIKYVYDIIK